LEKEGFRSLTVRAIAERAGINRATFYAHFPDKYGLLDHFIREAFRREIEKRTLDACHYSLENLAALILALCDFVGAAHDHCATADARFESLVEAQVKRELQDLLEFWLAGSDSDVDVRTAATAASWAIYGLVAQWSHDNPSDRPSAEAFANSTLPLVAANLGQPA
jgi:AcrR family transcriptional regulator